MCCRWFAWALAWNLLLLMLRKDCWNDSPCHTLDTTLDRLWRHFLDSRTTHGPNTKKEKLVVVVVAGCCCCCCSNCCCYCYCCFHLPTNHDFDEVVCEAVAARIAVAGMVVKTFSIFNSKPIHTHPNETTGEEPKEREQSSRQHKLPVTLEDKN